MSEPVAPKLTYREPKVETNKDKAAQYVPHERLVQAVQVAVDLGMPLLVTGEPGTGKTQLAHWLALEMNRLQPEVFGTDEPLVFNTKSTSVFSDLFYRYDAMLHFHQGKENPIGDYIHFDALGKAILRARDERKRTVVLIDEVDKAPRDLPNDILSEVEEMRFRVKESGEDYFADPRFKPILVFTSNKERDLPDAFRRRCVFYHLEFGKLDLDAIVRARLKLERGSHDALFQVALAHFNNIRLLDRKLDKLPATAELINWIRYLVDQKADLATAEGRKLLEVSYSLLAKSDADLAEMGKVKLPGA
jgi:MoxR-like ATPase